GRVSRRRPQAGRRHARAADARPRAFATVFQMSIALKVSGLVAGYGKKRVVDGIDFEVPAGGIVLLLGHNGAGKTSFARALFGLLPIEAGRVWLGEQEITGRSPARNVASGFAFVPQGHGVFRTLSVADNLELGAFVENDRSKLD